MAKGQTRKKLNADTSKDVAIADLKAKLGGRPQAIPDLAILSTEIREYFDSCEKSKTMPNKAGLCVWLGVHRDTLNAYTKKDHEFSDAIRMTFRYIEDAWIQRLARAYPQGAMFYLKNAFRYVDEIKQDHTSGGKPINYTVPAEIAHKHVLDVAAAPEPIKLDENGAAPVQQLEDEESEISTV